MENELFLLFLGFALTTLDLDKQYQISFTLKPFVYVVTCVFLFAVIL